MSLVLQQLSTTLIHRAVVCIHAEVPMPVIGLPSGPKVFWRSWTEEARQEQGGVECPRSR